jgi:hypothetical protein
MAAAGKGARFLQGYLKEKAFPGGSSTREDINILGAARNLEEAGGAAGVEYGKDKPYYPFQRGKETTDSVIQRVAENTGLEVDDVLSQLGGAEQAEASMRANQKMAASHQAGIGNAVHSAVEGVGADLISNNPELRAKAIEAMNITAEKIQMVHGPAASDGFKAQVAAKLTSGNIDTQKEALQELGIAEAQFSTVLKPEVNDAATFQMPYLKDMPLWGHGLGAGAAAAGAGALAYHLMAGGQQQQDSAAYAATVQAMNAY